MEFKAKTLEDIQTELFICSPPTDLQITPLTLYHYTSNNARNIIVNEEEMSVNFRLTKASDFLDKNEGTYILEPYYHACGSLYDKNIIDFDFYSILKSIKSSSIKRNAKNFWILCLTAEGYSKFMKERYAPNDGWLIELAETAFDKLIRAFNSENDTNFSNWICMAEVRYTYYEMKEQLQDVIHKIFDRYNSDNSKSKKKKRSLVLKTLKQYLSQYNFCYKSESYKDEKEIRLICCVDKRFDNWVNKSDPQMYLYFKDNRLYLHLAKDCYRRSMQQPNVYNAIEMNKSIITSEEIRNTLKNRS